MLIERRVAIARQIIAQLEDTAEAIAFEAKIAKRVEDEKGLEAAKSKLSEIQKKVEAAQAIVAEIEAEAKKE